MERKPVLSQSAIRKAVITTFVFGSGRCRGSSPERSTPKRTPKPCQNVSAGAGDGECGTGGNDSRPGFSFAPQNVAGNGRPTPAGTTMPCDLGPLGRQKSVFPGRNDVSCTADGHTWPGTDMGYNLRPPYRERGLIPFSSVGGKYFYRENDVAAFLESRTEPKRR